MLWGLWLTPTGNSPKREKLLPQPLKPGAPAFLLPNFTFNKGKRKGGRWHVHPGQDRASCEGVSSPPLGGCKQSTDKTQLHLEGHMSIYQVWQEKILESPKNPELSEIWNEAQNQTIPSSSCLKEPLSTYFLSALCLFDKLREVRWFAQEHTASWGQSGDWSPSPPAVSWSLRTHPTPQNTSEPPLACTPDGADVLIIHLCQ